MLVNGMNIRIILVAPASPNPKDIYLERVLAELEKGNRKEYVVWDHNKSIPVAEGSMALSGGHYCLNFNDAYSVLLDHCKNWKINPENIKFISEEIYKPEFVKTTEEL